MEIANITIVPTRKIIDPDKAIQDPTNSQSNDTYHTPETNSTFFHRTC